MKKTRRKTPGSSAEEIARDYIARAESERRAGGSCSVDTGLPSVSISHSDGSEFYFQEHRADEILDEARTTMRDTGLEGLLSIEDFLLVAS